MSNPAPAPASGHHALVWPTFWALLRSVITAALLVTLYALLPGTRRSSAVTALIFAVGVVLLVVVVVWQLRSIITSRHPGLRAVEAMATIVPSFLLLFSLTYLLMSQSSPSTFNVPLTHIRALYFTVVVFATVGFGDIVAKTDVARLLVTVQIVLDLILIGVVARFVVAAVQRGRARRAGDGG